MENFRFWHIRSQTQGRRDDHRVLSAKHYARNGDTVNLRPRRHDGTYTAPEVQEAVPYIDTLSPFTEKDQGIGHKSDVWSFGCIVAEILAFALGGPQHVKAFTRARQANNCTNDYFYEEKREQSSITTTHLTMHQPSCSTSFFQVQKGVLQWLDKAYDGASSEQTWIRCVVGTIKMILVTDRARRPNSEGLLNLLKHVQTHAFSFDVEDHVHCEILSPPIPAEQQMLPIKQRPVVHKGWYKSPQSKHDSLFDDTSSQRRGDSGVSSEENTEPVQKRQTVESWLHNKPTDSGIIPEHETIPGQPSSERVATSAIPTRSGRGSSRIGHAIRTAGSGNPKSLPTRSERSSVLGDNEGIHAYEALDDLYGLLINPETPRIIRKKPNIQKLTSGSKLFNRKATAVAVNSPKHDLFDVAYLVQDTVHFFLAHISQVKFSASHEFLLPQSRGWTDIALGGQFVAIWGHLQGTGKLVSPVASVMSDSDMIYQIHICDANAPNIRTRVDHRINIGLLQKVAVSQHGIAALLCGGTIFVLTIE